MIPKPGTEKNAGPRLRWFVPGLLFVLLILSGCALFGNTISQEPRSDAIISTRIKSRLIDHPAIDAAAINVESNMGRVVLKGFVGSEAESEQAVKIAREESGVREVSNEIVVK